MKKRYISRFLNFIFAYVFSFFFYKRRYLKGKYFSGKAKGVFSLGWQWASQDIRSRIFLGANKAIPFPVSFRNDIVNYENLDFHLDDLNNFQGSGKYFQANGKITIGKGTWIANNVGIITANHDLDNLGKHKSLESVVIGENCWIGMGAIILPGVTLGNNTIVGAGAIVTKSFAEGNMVIAGNPAKIIRKIDRNEEK